MYSRGRHTAGFAATLFALLFVFTLRALVPVGYMPEAGEVGVHLVICGPAAPGGHGEGPGDDEGPAKSESVCVFAAAPPVAGPADPPPPPLPPVLAPVHDSRPALRDAPAADRSEGPPPPARAPPLSI